MSIIHIFGNPLLPFDSLPIKFVPRLQKIFPKIEFKIFDPSENLKPENKKLFIIDTVEGIEKVTLIKDILQIKTDRIHSLHDFDLGFNLKLLHKIGELEEVVIVGVPMEVRDEERVFEEVVEGINKIFNF